MEQHGVNSPVCLIGYIVKKNEALRGNFSSIIITTMLMSLLLLFSLLLSLSLLLLLLLLLLLFSFFNAPCPQLILLPLNVSYNLSSLGRSS